VLPSGYSCHPASWDDLNIVVALKRAHDLAFGDWSDASNDRQRLVWETPGFLISRDTWLVFAGEKAVAYGEVTVANGKAYIEGCVVREHVGKGLGSFLLRAGEDVARGATSFELGSFAQDGCASQLAQLNGYAEVRTMHRMKIDLSSRPSLVSLDGVTIRSMRSGEEQLVYENVHAAFAENGDWDATSYEEWRRQRFERDDASFELYMTAWCGSELVGSAQGLNRGEGWISAIAVLPSFRRRGIGNALLHATMVALYDAGVRTIGLGVASDNASGALGIYERAGFRLEQSVRIWGKGG